MGNNTISIRISSLNKKIISELIRKDFIEQNPEKQNPTIDELIAFLLKHYYKQIFPLIVEKIKNDELHKHHKKPE